MKGIKTASSMTRNIPEDSSLTIYLHKDGTVKACVVFDGDYLLFSTIPVALISTRKPMTMNEIRDALMADAKERGNA